MYIGVDNYKIEDSFYVFKKKSLETKFEFKDPFFFNTKMSKQIDPNINRPSQLDASATLVNFFAVVSIIKMNSETLQY